MATLDEMHRRLISRARRRHKTINGAARALGISARTINRWLHRWAREDQTEQKKRK